MASPFAVFRRNQRVMLAIVGVLAMIAFVFLGPLMQYSGGRGTNPADEIVVETKYGPIRRSGLESLVRTRELVDLFLHAIAKQSVQTLIPGLDERSRQGDEAYVYDRLKQNLMFRYQQIQGAEHAALETYLLAKKAEQMNIVVTNTAINEYLKIIIDKRVLPELPQIINGLSHHHNDVSQKQLFDALRTELMASKVLELLQSGLRVYTPAERWDYYTRLNRGATTEVMTLPVESFLDQVRQPTDKEIQAYFDEYKNQFQYPGSPVPGFKLPPTFDFQYFKVVFDDLVDESKVTEAEIKKYYEEHKDLEFRHREPAEDEKAVEKKSDEKATAAQDESGPQTPPADEKKPAPDKDDEKQPAADEKKDAKDAENSADTKTPPAAEEKPAESKADQKKADPAQTPKKKPGAKPAIKDKKTGAALERNSTQRPRARVLLTSGPTQADPPKGAPQPEKSADAAAKPAASKAAEKTATKGTENKTEPAAAPEKGAAASPEPATESAKNSEKKSDSDAKESKSAEKTEPAAGKEEGPGDGKDKKQPAPPKYDPLEKVQDVIRKGLAEQQAAQKLQEISLRLQSEMRRAGAAARFAAAKAKGGAGDEAVPKLDFDKLAKLEGVETYRTGLLSADDLLDTDIGKSYEEFSNRVSGALQHRRFLELALAKGRFQQALTTDNERNEYIFWRTDETAEKLPTLDQVHKKVIREWRLGQARELARKKAAEDTQKARENGGSLEEIFGKDEGVKINKVGPFTWYTMGTAPSDPGAGQPRLSQVPDLTDAGQDFMKTVFGLAPSEYGWTMNEPQMAAYVIRLLEFEPSTEQLRDDFVQTPFGKYWQVGNPERSNEIRNWMNMLRREADVRDVRPLDLRGQPVE